MIRIAYVVSTLKRCGPNSQLRNIIRHLDRDRFSPLLITLSPEPADSALPLFERDAIPVIRLNLTRLQGLVRARPRLRTLLREQQIDILHTQGIRADSLAAALRREWPAVCSVRNFPQMDYPMTYGRVRGAWMARAHAHSLRRVAAPVGVSAAVSRNLEQQYGIRARTFCNGVDTGEWVPPAPQERENLRAGMGVDSETFLWVSVGHLSPRKDPLTLIRAFRNAGREPIRLVFLGSGPLEEACRHAAAGDERILFAGRVERVADYLKAADGFVSASLAEGFPNAALEALACGLPCLLSDIPPHRELAEPSGDCIGLFPPGDVSALAGEVFRREGNESFRRQARCAAETVFSAAAMSTRYQQLYQGLLDTAE